MCGIVGYIGEKDAADIVIEGLKKLEYRGYDSAGLSILKAGHICTVKKKGRIAMLEQEMAHCEMGASLAIGHTRWATHGEPSDLNSHPHNSMAEKISLVHNGIIENYLEIGEFLKEKGYTFRSQTDTEVASHLFEYYYDGDILKAARSVMEKIRGSYAFGVILKDRPGTLVAMRKESPLIIGIGKEENFIASDVTAVLEHTREIYIMNDYETAIVTKDLVEVYDKDACKVTPKITSIDWDISLAEKGGYDHFMLKEINEQPKAISDTVLPRLGADSIVLDAGIPKGYIEGIEKIFVVACGTAYHAGMVGKYLIESMARIPVEAVIASEFRYMDPIVDEKTLTIIISQSGETADTIAALKEAKKKGSKTLAIVNVKGSTIARDADYVLYTHAGPEIAVASTKAYTTQLAMFYLLASEFAFRRGKLSAAELKKAVDEIRAIPAHIGETLRGTDAVKTLAEKYSGEKSVFFLGRGIDYAVALEGSLKLKEISYIHCEAYAAGELKHGTIALIEKGTLVVAIATQEALYEKLLSNIKEVKARGAKVLVVTTSGAKEFLSEADYLIKIPEQRGVFAAASAVIPLQLFSYYCALSKGCDVDKPRNLAKSVTVE